MTTYNKIIEAGLSLLEERGFNGLTRCAVAERAGVCYSLVHYHIGGGDAMLGCLMREAVNRQHLGALAAGLASRHPVALEAPAELKQAAIINLQAKCVV